MTQKLTHNREISRCFATRLQPVFDRPSDLFAFGNAIAFLQLPKSVDQLLVASEVLKAEQLCEFNDEATVLLEWEAMVVGCAAFGIDNKQVAAGFVLPSEPDIGVD